MVGGDDLAGALCMLFRRSWRLLMRQGNLFTKCTDEVRLGEMAAAEACLLCIGVELGMLYMCALAAAAEVDATLMELEDVELSACAISDRSETVARWAVPDDACH